MSILWIHCVLVSLILPKEAWGTKSLHSPPCSCTCSCFSLSVFVCPFRWNSWACVEESEFVSAIPSSVAKEIIFFVDQRASLLLDKSEELDFLAWCCHSQTVSCRELTFSHWSILFWDVARRLVEDQWRYLLQESDGPAATPKSHVHAFYDNGSHSPLQTLVAEEQLFRDGA